MLIYAKINFSPESVVGIMAVVSVERKRNILRVSRFIDIENDMCCAISCVCEVSRQAA